ncbi:MAG: endolytic transglycosylase MltG [Chitinophagales bacterium]
MAKKRKQQFSKLKKFLFAFGGLLLLFAVIIAFSFYQKIYAPGVEIKKNDPYLYLPTSSNYDDLIAILEQNQLVHSIENFDWVARKMNLQNHIHPGKYKLEKNMSNSVLARLLRSGKQEPVKLVLKKFRLKEDVVSFVSHKLEADSITLITALNDPVYLRNFNLEPDAAIALFIPNTYEFYWNTSSEQFLIRMKKEYDRFWNEQRKQLAKSVNLTPVQVITLASIIEEETNYNHEKPRMAGLYLNRLKAGMKLQADPTVKFALKNFTLRRILYVHLSYESQFNTYRYPGLPPGPICTPSITSVDAVLHAERNDYFYFCADPDKPGTSVFARTLKEHQLNARRYQYWLDGIGVK